MSRASGLLPEGIEDEEFRKLDAAIGALEKEERLLFSLFFSWILHA